MVARTLKKSKNGGKRGTRSAARNARVAPPAEESGIQGQSDELLPPRNTIVCRLYTLHDKVGEVIAVHSMIHQTVMLMEEHNEGEDMEMPLHELRLALEVLWRMLREVEEDSQECMILAPER
jgi:hypothetical protein